ncbi:PLDc N-terminal domain-containing protein [Curtobacterium sp. PhB115]|uniref:PLDc N-terminal domain-containing protein n=1 Tax=Curtobacterium sp. PhB115 TaxID=2485173 RepID=UPI000FBA8171|nr:PLDc N-terminal domain-containing protein [Curtobacterium sp. PhB115]ROP58678.1 phospholipase D-like protein [Curtobacterium sp. PhB115]
MMFTWTGPWGGPWDGVGAVLWSFFWIVAFVAYLFALFAVISDLFRDHTLNGWWKAVWIAFLVFVPFLTVLVYLVARGRGMQERAAHQAERFLGSAEPPRPFVGNAHPAEEIRTAKALLDEGTITPAEFEVLKGRALQQ